MSEEQKQEEQDQQHFNDGGMSKSGLEDGLRQYLRETAQTVELAGGAEWADAPIVASNALQEINGKEINVITDPRGSRSLESLLPFFSASDCAHLLHGLTSALLDGCWKDGCASRTLEKLFASITTSLTPGKPDEDKKAVAELMGELMGLCGSDVFVQSLGDMAKDLNGTHVARALLPVLQTRPELHDLLRDMVVAVVNNLVTVGVEGLQQAHISATLQAVIDALKPLPGGLVLAGAVSHRISQSVTEDRDVLFLAKDPSASHLMEKVITELPPGPVFADVYSRWLRGKLIAMSEDRLANHIVQALFTAQGCGVAEVTMAVQELLPKVWSLVMRPDRCGVIMKAAEACAKLHVLEKELADAIRYKDADSKPQATGDEALKTLPIFAENVLGNRGSPAYVKSRLAQILLTMRGEVARSFMASLAALPAERLVELCCDKTGSRVFEAAMTQQAIPDGAKVAFVNKLKGQFVAIAMGGPSGSRVVECLYRCVDVKTKEMITSELAEKEEEIAKDFTGKFVLRTCKVKLFKEKKDQWLTGLKQNVRKREMFADIVADENGDGTQQQQQQVNRKKKQFGEEDDESTPQYEEFMRKLGFGGKAFKQEKVKEEEDVQVRENDGEGGEEEEKQVVVENKKRKKPTRQQQQQPVMIKTIDEEKEEHEALSRAVMQGLMAASGGAGAGVSTSSKTAEELKKIQLKQKKKKQKKINDAKHSSDKKKPQFTF